MTVMNHTARPVGKRTSIPTAADVDQAEPLFEEAPAPPARRISISTTITHRGRQLTITAENYTADEFCDLLDKRFGVPDDAPVFRQSPAAPICPVHGKPMKPMTHADKRGRQFWCTVKVGDAGYCDERA